MTLLTQPSNVRWTKSPAGLWTPAQITTSLWLDAADTATITTVSSAVSQWNDKSGNSRNATQGTSTARPAYTSAAQNGLNALTFDGANDFMLTNSASYAAVNYFMVGRVISASGNDALFSARLAESDKGGNSDIAVSLSVNNNATAFSSFGGNSTYAMFNGSPVASLTNFQNYLVGSTSTGIGWFTFDMAISSTTSGTKIFCLGADIYSPPDGRTPNCNIGEFVVTSSQLTAADRERMQGYLAHKWGLANNLPINHPYKTSPPYITY